MTVFVIGGLVYLASIQAAGVFVAAEPETGTASGGAVNLADSNASGGSAVRFTSPTPSTTEAGVLYKWGTPNRVENMDNLNNFDLYTANGDWGTKRPANITVAGGIMTINGKSDGTTGGMEHNYDQKYGKWEARMQVIGHEGCWRPALILWRSSGNLYEIDYAETSTSFSYTRFALSWGTGVTKGVGDVNAREWNYYAVEWTPGTVRGYINGVKFFEDNDVSHQPTIPMHQTFQLDAQTKAGTCTTNTQMLVDWLKVYP